jgi:hypothetical protein
MASLEGVKEVEILVGPNYYPWARRVKAALSQKRWWETTDPGYDDDEEKWTEQMKQKNEDALNYSLQRVDDLNVYNIDDCIKAKDAWYKLKNIQTKIDGIQFVDILEELCTTNKTGDVTMREYIGKITKLMREVISVLDTMKNLPDAMTAGFLIRGLRKNPKYDFLVKSLRDTSKLTADDIKSMLMFEERQEDIDAIKEETVAVAFKSRVNYPRKEKNYSQESYKPQPNRGYYNKREENPTSQGKKKWVCFACSEAVQDLKGQKGSRNSEERIEI